MERLFPPTTADRSKDADMFSKFEQKFASHLRCTARDTAHNQVFVVMDSQSRRRLNAMALEATRVPLFELTTAMMPQKKGAQ